jgi:hypothetical protein
VPRDRITATARLQHRKMDLVRKAKERPCTDCKISYPYYVMDLDHRPDEEKLFNLGYAARCSYERVIAEIAKCDPVCANCHRERTHKRKTYERRQLSSSKYSRRFSPDWSDQTGSDPIGDAEYASNLLSNKGRFK